jgi:hypothetical protein
VRFFLPGLPIAKFLILSPRVLCADEVVTIPGPGEPTVDATVNMSGGLVALGVGYGWGHGTISYQGMERTFCIHGLSIGDVGAADLKAQGVVFHLQSLRDFPGKYFALSTGVALVRGESGAVLKNEHGVTMQLEAKVAGLRFNIAASGMRITLAGHHGCPNPPAATRQ